MFDRGPGSQYGVGGAPPRLLDKALGAGRHALRLGGDGLLTGTDDHGGGIDLRLRHRRQHMRQQRASRNRVQDLG